MGLIEYAERQAAKEEKRLEIIQAALLEEADDNCYGMKLIESVTEQLRKNGEDMALSEVQEIYWLLLKTGKLNLPK